MGFYSSNNVVQCMTKQFSVSDEFRHLCTGTKVSITPHRIDVTPSYVLCCSVHKNFAMIWLLTSTCADIFCNCLLPIFHCYICRCREW